MFAGRTEKHGGRTFSLFLESVRKIKQEERSSNSEFWWGKGISEATGSPRMQLEESLQESRGVFSCIAIKERFVKPF